jgi:hypothetical protein
MELNLLLVEASGTEACHKKDNGTESSIIVKEIF